MTLNERLHDAITSANASADAATAWAELAGFTDRHTDPSRVLRAILDEAPILAATFMTSFALGDVVSEIAEHEDGDLPPLRRILTATQSALRIIHDAAGPFDDEDEFRETARSHLCGERAVSGG